MAHTQNTVIYNKKLKDYWGTESNDALKDLNHSSLT